MDPLTIVPFAPADVLFASALQAVEVPGGADVDVTVGLGGSATGAFLTTLLVGAIMVALAPAYTERMMETVREDVVGSFVYGILSLIAVFAVTFLLVLSIIGILFVIPFVLLAWLVWAIGASVAFLAIADRLVDRGEGWLKPLVVAAAINGGLTLSGIGAIVSIAVGAAGFGAVLRDRLA